MAIPMKLKQFLKEKKYYLLIVLAVVLLAALVTYIGVRLDRGPGGSILPFDTASQYPMDVAFVNVGQGDGIVIRCEDAAIVIDGGEQTAAAAMKECLKNENITDVDCYIATHPHSDHIGAIPAVMKAVNVKTFMMTEFSELNMPTTRNFEQMVDAVEDEGCEVLFVRGGEEYTFGKMKLQILAPLEETNNYNNMSIVVRLVYGEISFLLTGDAEKDVEAQILAGGADVDADVIKLGHHGSSNASSRPFIEAVSPLIAVISCGADNDYGHPHKETLELMKELSVRVLRTDTDGTVHVYSDGKNVFTKELVG
ncbi:MAG: MBL fold metallo-hydrolase [Clostridia bacterium]|nr:MBL fold metallo-hydrolase [Clostridia bacterium]